MDFPRILSRCVKELGLELAPQQLEGLAAFWRLVKQENRRHNLTAIVDDKEAAVKHFADSLTPLLLPGAVPDGASLVDVGSGAGFPGIPLAVARPDLRVFLLESVGKKAAFLAQAAEKLGLAAQVIHTRAEAAGRDPRWRESFDVAVARALAALPTATEWCLPLVRVGGRFIALRGAKGEEDLAEARRAIAVLGGRLGDVRTLELPEGAGRRVVIAIEKVRPTPTDYPREGGAARRKPL